VRVPVNVGDIFGKWTVLAGSDLRGNERYYACQCSCGTITMVRKSTLVADKSGCQKCAPNVRRTTHGKTRCFEFNVWTAMKRRCLYTKHIHYELYGGRGITIDPTWMNFEQFYRDMKTCPYGKAGSLERLDPNKGYAPDNCKWILRTEQSKNRRNVPMYEGLTLPDLADKLGVKYTTLKRRIAAGWPKEKWGLTPKQLGTRK